MSAQIELNHAGEVSVSGELNMQSVPDAATKVKALLEEMLKTDGQQQIVFDFSDITRSDSAGVALLVDVMQQARLASQDVMFSNIPRQMKDIAKISGLLEILPVS